MTPQPDPELAALRAAVDDLEARCRQLAARVDAVERTLQRAEGDNR